MERRIRPMTDKEAMEQVKKYGGYASYRMDILAGQPDILCEESAQKSTNIMTDAYEVAAKAQRITLAEFFKRNPDEYRRYCELAKINV